MPPVDDPLSAIIDTDRRYFDLAAKVESFAGAEIAWMAGLESVGSGVVVQRVDPGWLSGHRGKHLVALEDRLRAIGAMVSRIYLDAPSAELEALLSSRGYVARNEIAFHGRLAASASRSMRLTEILSPADWSRKLDFHRGIVDLPDGYGSEPQQWVELERRKCATGEMTMYLAVSEDGPVATVGALPSSPWFRVKNLLVHPRARCRGVASWLLTQLTTEAFRFRCEKLCLFALQGGAGERLYRKMGFKSAGVQVEWMRHLD